MHPETQSVSKQEPGPAAEICFFHLFSLNASNVWASAGLKNTAQPKAQPLRFAAPRCGDAGYIPLRLDFQVGESSGPSCSSPSLIIPVGIIPLNSRRLEGKKKNPHLSTAKEQEMQSSAWEAAALGDARADCCVPGASCPLEGLQTKGAERVQLHPSSASPAGLGAAPHTPKAAVDWGHARGSMPCRAWPGGLDSEQ